MLSLYRLPKQEKDEEIIKVIRRDFFILFLKIMFFALLCVIPLGFFAVMSFASPNIFHGSVSGPLIGLSVSAYYLFAWLFFFFSFIDYYLDVWIITSERIIDIQQNGFFSRVISEHKLFRIQDVTSEVHGLVPTLLKFGNVHVQTAGIKERFFFHEVPNPDEIRDTIIRLAKISQKKHKDEINREDYPEQNISVRENYKISNVMKH